MLDLSFDVLATIGMVTLTPDGDINTPTQISVGGGGQIILHADGKAEFATGVSGVHADGTFFFADASFETFGGILVATNLITVQDSAGNFYKIPAQRV